MTRATRQSEMIRATPKGLVVGDREINWWWVGFYFTASVGIVTDVLL